MLKIWIPLAFLFLCSCSRFFIVEQKDLPNDPCLQDSSQLNVRVRNTGTIPFSRFGIICEREEFFFPGLNENETSCYKTIPFLSGGDHNRYKTYFLRNKKNGKQLGHILDMTFIPFVDGDGKKKRTLEEFGYEKYTNGFFTIEVSVIGERRKQRKVNIKMVRDD